jgi:hypothetical protein
MKRPTARAAVLQNARILAAMIIAWPPIRFSEEIRSRNEFPADFRRQCQGARLDRSLEIVCNNSSAMTSFPERPTTSTHLVHGSCLRGFACAATSLTSSICQRRHNAPARRSQKRATEAKPRLFVVLAHEQIKVFRPQMRQCLLDVPTITAVVWLDTALGFSPALPQEHAHRRRSQGTPLVGIETPSIPLLPTRHIIHALRAPWVAVCGAREPDHGSLTPPLQQTRSPGARTARGRVRPAVPPARHACPARRSCRDRTP